MNALKDILVDAARYRWVRENLYVLLDWADDCGYDATHKNCDDYIDKRLSDDE